MSAFTPYGPSRCVKSFLKKRVVKEKLKKICSRKGLPVSGSKNDLIERVLKHYALFELFDSLDIFNILSWEEMLYISTLLDGEKSRREILAHPNVSGLMEKRYIRRYEKDRFLSLRSVAVARRCGIVSLAGKKHRLNDPFKEYFRQRNEKLSLKNILSRYRRGIKRANEEPENRYEKMLEELRKKYPLPEGFIGFMGYDIRDLYPKELINIPHEGKIRIFAFSDYRIQKVEHLFRYLADRREKPDIILYAGDDIERFNYIPWDVIDARREESPKCDLGYYKEISHPWISISGRSISGPIIKFRVPKSQIDPADIKNAILKRIEQADDLLKKLKETLKDSADLKRKIQEVNASLENSSLKWRFEVQENSNSRCVTIHIHDEEFKTCIEKADFFRSVGGYLSILWRRLAPKPSTNALIKVTEFNDEFVTGYLQFSLSTSNLFEKLASFSKYGLAAVIGNDEPPYARSMIKGRSVYNVHYTPLKVGNFLILGQEGAVATERFNPGYVIYREGDVKFHLTLAAEKKSPSDKIIIVSHTPPQGILDRAIRFGERSIGSKALRDFIEERGDVALAVCGHVHSCGGRSERLNKALILNVSSHDNHFSRAKVAWITLSPDGTIDVKIDKIPSIVEDILTEEELSIESRIESLIGEAGIAKTHAPELLDCFIKYGKKFLDAMEDLAHLHFRYGFSWSHLTEMFRRGVTKESDVTEEIISKVAEKFSGIERRNLQQFWRRFESMRAESPYLLDEPRFLESSQIMLFDSEYAVAETNIPVLYGFLNTETGEMKHFWKGEEKRMAAWLKKYLSKNLFILHYGGDDRKLLCNAILETLGPEEMRKIKERFVNLLCFFQTSLVSPKLRSVSLESVFDALHGNRMEDSFWKENFYMINGMIKNALCHKLLSSNLEDDEVKQKILNANKADLLALKEILKCICNLKVKDPKIQEEVKKCT